MDIKQIVLDLCAMNDEQEWFEFKENWFLKMRKFMVKRRLYLEKIRLL